MTFLDRYLEIKEEISTGFNIKRSLKAICKELGIDPKAYNRLWKLQEFVDEKIKYYQNKNETQP